MGANNNEIISYKECERRSRLLYPKFGHPVCLAVDKQTEGRDREKRREKERERERERD